MPHVLVIDDEPEICTLVQMALESDGVYRVTAASRALDALAVLRRDRPQGALIDATMPAVSGMTLASHSLALNVPVLMMTGVARNQEIFSAHGIPFLAKPFRIRDVVGETQLLLREGKERHAQLRMQLARLAANVGELKELLEQSRENLARLIATRHELDAASRASPLGHPPPKS